MRYRVVNSLPEVLGLGLIVRSGPLCAGKGDKDPWGIGSGQPWFGCWVCLFSAGPWKVCMANSVSASKLTGGSVMTSPVDGGTDVP